MRNSVLLGGRDSAVLIIVVGSFCLFVTMGVRQSFGLFLTPYTEAFSIGRDSFALAVALQNVVWGLASPLFGALADRRGPVVAVALGGVFYTAGMLVMAASGGTGELIFAQMLVGAGLAGAGFSVVLGTVGKAVSEKNRSFALAVVSAAGSFGQFALVPVAQVGIEAWGIGGGAVLLAVPAFLMIVFAPFLRLPRSAPRAEAGVGIGSVTRMAFSSRSYLLLFTGFFVCGLQVVFVSTHLPAFVKDLGLPASAAVTALAMIGLFNVFGTLVCGWLGGVLPKKYVLSVFYCLRSLVMVAFLLTPVTPLSVAVFGAAIGFLWLGTVPLTSGLIAVFFGPRYMSMLYGFVFLSHQAGSFLGAWLGGYWFETTGSYMPMWIFAIVMGFVAGVLHLPIRERAVELTPTPALAR